MNIPEHDPADKSSSERVAAFVDASNVIQLLVVDHDADVSSKERFDF